MVWKPWLFVLSSSQDLATSALRDGVPTCAAHTDRSCRRCCIRKYDLRQGNRCAHATRLDCPFLTVRASSKPGVQCSQLVASSTWSGEKEHRLTKPATLFCGSRAFCQLPVVDLECPEQKQTLGVRSWTFHCLLSPFCWDPGLVTHW